MTTNWRMETGFCKSIFDDFTDIGAPISQGQKVNVICPHCSYHTAWKRADDWINCGWCLEFVGNGADMRKSEFARYKLIADVKKAITDADLQGINLKNKIAATVKQCGDRDKLLYQSWEFLPSADHTRMLAGIQDLIKPKAAIASVPSEEYYANIDF